MLNKAGLHDVHSTLVYCLTSFSKMPDFGTLSGELMASLPYINSLSSVSRWHIMEHLSNCLPERFSHLNETNDPSLNHDCEKKIVRLEKGGAIYKPESGGDANTEKKQNKVNQAENTKKLSEEKRLMKKQERSRKAELKDETAKQKQLAKERKKLEKHKFSEKDIVAVIDPKVLSGLVGAQHHNSSPVPQHRGPRSSSSRTQ
ncbi:uncharacterized protein LOC110717142 [Chenopodium quinoa]|uniref:uncharacterized protein LOC110717142 n=1 Tax=Chenopodium quinoa TaxID=63459 RepID=UPI000B7952B9|nr:uncharacterized protein LOC110717142 [Chenopodium quinoa]XP_021751469.1 uncharacterized protein LOC110717142 [Chenopodium quinoa]XP_021751470.1 uncharacterized protein LOC110717142 [Chenopodium quinoa]